MSLGSAYPIVNGVRPQIGLFDLKNTQNYQWDNLRIEGSTFDKVSWAGLIYMGRL